MAFTLVALVLAALLVSASAAPSKTRHGHRRHRHRVYLGVGVEVAPVLKGTRAAVTLRLHERQRIVYTIEIDYANQDRVNCDIYERLDVSGRPGRTQTVRVAPSPGDHWCVGRSYDVYVFHVTYGPDPCAGVPSDEFCRNTAPQYEKTLGRNHFRVVS